jgi:septal ring factor EnvC (AmiA/AmiB activator)
MMTAPWVKAVAGRLLLLTACWLLLAGGAAGDELERQRQSLKQVEQGILRVDEQLKSKRRKQGALETELDKLEKELSGLRRNVRRREDRLEHLKKTIGEKKLHAGRLREQIRKRETRVKTRLAAFYRQGEVRLYKLLFQGRSPARIAENGFFLTRLVRQDRALLASFRDDWRTLRGALEELRRLQEEQQSRLRMLRESQHLLTRGCHAREQGVERLKKDRQALAGELTALREKARRLQGLLKRLETEQSSKYIEKTGIFAKQKGRLRWPAEGAVVVGFGANHHRKLGTRYQSQGIEIAQPPGRDIRAVWGGKVLFADNLHGYGKLIILNHGESYYTLYAQAEHLARKVGEQVAAGEVLGTSGFGGRSGVYFEIRHRGEPLDPGKWLAPRCR